MTDEKALAMILAALEKTIPNVSSKVSKDSHLLKDGIIDSLDSMNFLFELEKSFGRKLEEISETFDDFRIDRLVEILKNA